MSYSHFVLGFAGGKSNIFKPCTHSKRTYACHYWN